MLITQNLAEKLNPADYNQVETRQQPSPSGHLKKHFCVSRGQRLVFTGLVLASFLTGVLIACYYAQIFSMGYEMSKIKKQISSIQNESQNIEVEIIKLSSLDRVESMATQKLGMVEPGRDIVMVDAPLKKENVVKSDVQQELTPVTIKNTENVPSEKVNWVIQSLTHLVSYLQQQVRTC